MDIDIAHFLHKEENQNLEYKESFLDTQIAETIASFSTANGGLILVGVKNDGSPVGIICSEDEIQRRIFNIENNMNKHRPILRVKFVEHTPKEKIVVIQVKEGPKKPYGWNGVYYSREGSTNKKLGPEEIAEINLTSRSFSFDGLKASIYDRDACIGDLDEKRINSYIYLFNSSPRNKKMQYTNIHNFLCNFNLILNNSIKNASILFFAKNPQTSFPNSAINFLIYKGNIEDSSKLKYKKLIQGDLISQINEVVDLIKLSTENKVIMDGLRRIEINQYPIEAIREAVINAIAHRDYSIFDSFVNIRLFADRLEITNPGPLVEGLTIEKIKMGGLSKRRNPLICSLLDNLGFMEQSGQGIKNILSSMKKFGLREPEIENSEYFFMVKFFGQSLNLPNNKVVGVATDLSKQLTEMQQLGLNRLREKNMDEITIKKYMKTINTTSRITAKSHLERFVGLGLLKSYKVGKTIVYKKVF